MRDPEGRGESRILMTTDPFIFFFLRERPSVMHKSTSLKENPPTIRLWHGIRCRPAMASCNYG